LEISSSLLEPEEKIHTYEEGGKKGKKKKNKTNDVRIPHSLTETPLVFFPFFSFRKDNR
jgi:hypothetical protein